MGEFITRNTKCGTIKGIHKGDYQIYLGIPYATAKRFEYATPVTSWEGEFDATEHGDVCIQKRVWYAHLEIPERMFYHKEFREGVDFTYSEDCLNLNIFTPSKPGKYPVIVFIHGGGFDSGSNYDSCIDGAALCQNDVVYVSINYRVGVFGYFSHEEVAKKNGHDGNFGLDDQYTALKWIKEHIGDFNGDSQNITVMGQSAGAMSIQYLCLCEKCKGLFQRAIMLSGAGLFPKFSLPKTADENHEYWLDVMKTAGANSFDAFQTMDAKEIFTALEEVKARRKDNTYHTMPAIDGYLINAPINELIKKPLPIDYMVGYTNNDMFAPILAHIAHKYAKQVHGYLYYFDIDAPGDDDNGAFHSSDLRYVFGTIKNSHRPYTNKDELISEMMRNYISNFARSGNPNYDGAPVWKKAGRKAIHITPDTTCIKMGRPSWTKLTHNMIKKGDPK